MSETRFFDPEAVPPMWTTPAWYAGIERAPHLEQDGHRPRLIAAEALVREAIRFGAESVSDLGAGDGGLLSLLSDVDAWGYDIIPANVDAAVNERHVAVTLRNFETDQVQLGECVVVTEVLEHLLDPHGMLRGMHDNCSEVRFVVASSPDGETWAQRYEFHTYGFDQAAYRAMFEGAGWTVLRHETVPGFQVLLAQR